MAVFNGTNIAISVDSQVIAHATECSISLSQDVIDVTTKDSSGVRDIIPGLQSGSMSISGLQDVSVDTGVNKLLSVYDAGAAVTCVFDTVASGGKMVTASGVITSLEISGGLEDAPTYSATIELGGSLTQADT